MVLGRRDPWGYGTVSQARVGTAPRILFLLEVLVEARMGISATGLVPMESGNSFGSLKVGLNGSLVALVEIFLPILSSTLGKVVAKRSADWLAVVQVRVKGIEQGWTNAN